MKQKSGVAQHSAGTPKLSMRDTPVAAPAPAPAPVPVAVDVDPFDTDGVAVQVEEDDDPFAHVAAPEHDTEMHVDFEDPFASSVASEHIEAETQVAHDDRTELYELLANARAIVAALEAALEHARENERVLNTRLGH
jgi:hypothetical protein